MEVKLKPEIRKKALRNDDLIIKLAKTNNKRFLSAYGWLTNQTKQLTEYNNLVIIAEFFKLTVDEIIEAPKSQFELSLAEEEKNH